MQASTNGTQSKTENKLLTSILDRLGSTHEETTDKGTLQYETNIETNIYIDKSLNIFEDVTRVSANQNHSVWAENLLDKLVPYVDGLQAAFYIYKSTGDHFEKTLSFPDTNGTDNNDEEINLNESSIAGLYLLSVYAIDKEDVRPYLKVGKGFSGQAARNLKRSYLNTGRGVVFSCKTATSRIQPAGILSQPLYYEGELEGLLEITSIYGFSDPQLLLIERLCSNIAASLRVQRMQQKMTQELESQVKSRTKDLEFALRNVQDAQQQLVLSEKMASLGQLVAGVAHEINTPIGAIKTSAGNIELDFADVVNVVPDFLRSLTDEQLVRFKSLLNIATQEKANRAITNQEERTLRKEIKAKLDVLKIKSSQDISRKFVDVGLGYRADEAMQIIDLRTEHTWLEILYIYADLNANIKNIITAVDKTSKIVFTLKSYAYKSAGNDNQPVDLKENIEVILTLYQSQFKQGVELTTSLEEGINVFGNSDELGQIWTNIVHNGLQAMKYKGRMLVKLYKEIDSEDKNLYAVVCISDNGPGIPPEAKEKIFEPFYTTKIKGEGTGLGLSLVSKIIKRHEGKISVESSPGGTSFYIYLPIISG